MATGYTAAIKDGIDFQTFALNCARAFGACVTLRDEPEGGDKIPDVFTEDPHYQARLDRAVEEREAWKRSSESVRQVRYMAECVNRDAEAVRIKRERTDLETKYRAMLDHVLAWHPPTPDHQGLKNFMREQIEESIKWDCSSTLEPPQVPPFDEWARRRDEHLDRMVKSASDDLAKERQRVAQRNEWVAQLRQSLRGRA